MNQPADVPRYPIESVGNALTLLTLLRYRKPVRTAEVADRLDIARSTAHRLLSTLDAHGFATLDESGRGYVAGAELRRLGATAVARLSLRRLAHQPLLDLARRSGETCELGILEANDILLVDVVEGTHPLRVVDRVGSRAPANVTAPGKALLASFSGEELEVFLDAEGAASASREDLLRELEDVRGSGYATARPSTDSGFVAFAAAVVTPQPHPRAAVTLVLPAVRTSDATASELGPWVVSAARAIEAAIAKDTAQGSGRSR